MIRVFTLAAVAFVLTAIDPATAQTRCRLTQKGERQVLQCGRTVTVEAEAGTRIESFDDNAVEVSGEGRVLARVRSRDGETAPAFQIRTPTAIASVRGTVWAMEVKPRRTSVYVRDGAVVVTRRSDGVIARLNPFQGVDVGFGVKFEKQTWRAERANALLNPFGLVVAPLTILRFGTGLLPFGPSESR